MAKHYFLVRAHRGHWNTVIMKEDRTYYRFNDTKQYTESEIMGMYKILAELKVNTPREIVDGKEYR